MGARARMPGGGKAEGSISAKSVHASPRQSVTLKPGRDFIPLNGSECVASSAPVGSATGHAFKISRETLNAERVNLSPSAPSYGVPMAETRGKGKRKRATGRTVETVRVPVDWQERDRNGTILWQSRVLSGNVTRVIRTEDLGDAPLPRFAMQAQQSAQRAQGKPAARVKREDKDADVRAYLSRLGFKGEITPFIRQRTLDAMAHAATVAEYAAAK